MTPAQQKVYDLMRTGAKAYRIKGKNTYWFLDVNLKHCTRQVEGLLRLGLVTIIQDTWNRSTAIAKD